MICCKVRVETTNSYRDAFRIGERYHVCWGGVIYVAAKDIQDAAEQIPEALSIEVVGYLFEAVVPPSRADMVNA